MKLFILFVLSQIYLKYKTESWGALYSYIIM